MTLRLQCLFGTSPMRIRGSHGLLAALALVAAVSLADARGARGERPWVGDAGMPSSATIAPDPLRWHRSDAVAPPVARDGMEAFGVLFATGSGEPRLSPQLDEILRRAGARETVPVLIHLQERGLSPADRALIRALPRDDRRETGVRLLRSQASRSQAEVLRHLRGLEARGEAQGIRTLYLVNAVAVVLPAQRVYDLLRFPSVRRIAWDPIVTFEDVADAEEIAPALDSRAQDTARAAEAGPNVRGGAEAPAAPAGTGDWQFPDAQIPAGGANLDDGLDPQVWPDLYRIRAPECWSAGYDGTGVLVAVLDKGVDYTHPDLTDHLWTNPGEIAGNQIDDDENGFVDDTIGWDFINNDNDPIEQGEAPHGTPVAGLVLGDGSAGFLTGSAPGADFLPVACISNSGNISLWFAGIDYAAMMGADVIVMSSTQKWIAQPNYDAWREITQNELDLGIVRANSIGNTGLESYQSPVPFNVSTPGNCPSPWQSPYDFNVGGRSSAVAVGALKQTDQIRDQSARGPSAWEDIAETWPFYPDTMRVAFRDYPWTDGSGGLLKPDLCAPGENVRSAGYAGSYILLSGTSFAAPYVGGAMAILLQARPSLTPEQIDEALQMTAVDMGATGKDPIYGAGRLDCYAALQYVLGLNSKSYLDGVVRSAASLDTLAGAEITLLPSKVFRSNAQGRFRLPVNGGLYSLVVRHYGFRPDTLTFNVPLGTVYNFTADLDTLSTASIVGTVTGPDALPVAGARVQIVGTPQVAMTDESGAYRFDDVPGGNLLTLEAIRFNYAVASDTLTPEPGFVDTLGFQLEYGLHDDFERDQGWTVGADGDAALRGIWERGNPVGTFSGGIPVQPEDDASPNGTRCFHTENTFTGAGFEVSEVRQGSTTLLSPLFDATVYSDPTLVYSRWFSNNAGAPFIPTDAFRVHVSADGGSTWSLIDSPPGAVAGAWTEVSVRLLDHVALTDSMQIRVVARDLTPAGIVEAAIDEVRISEDVSALDQADSGQTGPRFQLALHPGQPNPFRDATTIRFQVPASSEATLEVFDVQGRLVRRLVDGRVEAGVHSVQWDGRDDRGHALASGLYFYRLSQGGKWVSDRALRMR